MKIKKKVRKISKEAITKNMDFASVMHKHPETAEVFFKHGMACFGCPMAMSESIEAGAIAHGINPDKLVDELNKALKKKK